MLLLFLCATPLSAQTFVWQAGTHAFFDNEEYAHSSVQSSQTMSGVHIVPQVGVDWQGTHRIMAGVDVLKEFGSDLLLDRASLLAYYAFDGEYFDFRMGAFPRRGTLDRYPRMFFQDSIANFRPAVTGLFWEYHRLHGYANVWLDWTGKQTEEQRETFFIGWSGRYNKGAFYAQHFGYMYHFAKRLNASASDPLHDNGLLLTSAGIDFSHLTGFDRLELNAGWSCGLERNRDEDNRWYVPHGLLAELQVEFRGMGLHNTYYRGQPQQRFYPQYGHALYWGDTFYRTREYNRTDLYVRFVQSSVVNIKLSVSFHFAEGRMYNSQSLCATFDLNNFSKHSPDEYRYLWNGWPTRKQSSF